MAKKNRTPLTAAQQSLVESHIRLAYQFVHRKGIHQSSPLWDDTLAMAFEGLCRAARSYDPSKGRFSTIAYFAMDHVRLVDWRSRTAKHAEHSVPMSSIARTNDETDELLDPLATLADDLELESSVVEALHAQGLVARLDSIKSLLSPGQRRAFDTWLDLFNASGEAPRQVDVARLSGEPQPSVSRALTRVATLLARTELAACASDR